MHSSKTKMSIQSVDRRTKPVQRVQQTASAARVRDVRAQWTTPTGLLQLQRTVGNRAVSRLIQAKLIVGSADDPYEREAERAAARFGAPASAAEWPEQRIQTLPQTPVVGTEGGEACDEIERQLAASRGEGAPLPPDTRALMENHLGADFSDVRVHTDARASALNQQLGAQAFTYGTDIYVGEGRYNPQSAEGQRLLAHELTHVVQQTGGAQRRAGHEPVSRSAPTSIQRLMTSKRLKELAGEPHRDKKIFGITVWRMSEAYKEVLKALDAYHQAVEEASNTNEGREIDVMLAPRLQYVVAKVLEKLTDVETECRNYVASHADDARRTPHIQNIINDDIPAERAAIETVRNNLRNYVGMSLKDAIRMARMAPIMKATENTMLEKHNTRLKELSKERSRVQGAKPVPQSLDEANVEALSEEAVESFGKEMQGIERQRIPQGRQITEEERKVVQAQDFRGNAPAVSLGSALGYKVSQDYFRSVLAPVLSEVALISVSENDPEYQTKMQSAYSAFIERCLKADLVPIEFAKFCYSLYKKAKEHMEEEQAYLLVSSQIFLRTINPIITTMARNIPEYQPGQRALVQFSIFLQTDANYKDRGRDQWMPSYKDQVKSFVASVIKRGELFATVPIGTG